MKAERIPTRAAAHAAGRWVIATLFLLAPAAALGNGPDDECGVAEPCAGMSPLPASSALMGARRAARDQPPSVRTADRKASPRKTASKKTSLSAPILVATDAAAAAAPAGEPGRRHGRTK